MEIEQLQKDMIAAMKAKDKPRKEAHFLSGIGGKESGYRPGMPDDIKAELVDQVILKEQKTAKEQIDSCPESRQDLKAEYQFRYDVISEYAPKLMSPRRWRLS